MRKSLGLDASKWETSQGLPTVLVSVEWAAGKGQHLVAHIKRLLFNFLRSPTRDFVSPQNLSLLDHCTTIFSCEKPEKEFWMSLSLLVFTLLNIVHFRSASIDILVFEYVLEQSPERTWHSERNTKHKRSKKNVLIATSILFFFVFVIQFPLLLLFCSRDFLLRTSFFLLLCRDLDKSCLMTS